METQAQQVFDGLEKGILNIIKAADLFTIHLLANNRNEEPSCEVIQAILTGPAISGFSLLGESYNKEEINMFENREHVRRIGEQIILATYTAVEVYLIAKFKEYYTYFLKDIPSGLAQNSIKRFSFRSLEEIKNHFFDVLDIHLPSFEVEYYTNTKSQFQPKDSWTALVLLAKTRNEIAHTGQSTNYKIITLMDSWYPFDFARRWVSLFDANFDFFVYQQRETELIKEYKQRLQQLTLE